MIGLAMLIVATSPFCSTVRNSHKSVFGQESPMKNGDLSSLDLDAPPQRNFNLPLKTLGGWQFWTDYVIRSDWRIQQNVYTKSFRLLSPTDTRMASGNYAHCINEMDRILTASEAEPSPDKAIVLIHGLARSRSSMASMAKYLEANTQAQIVNFSYASTRGTLSDHAKALHHMLQHLRGVQEVSFVCHSLGNLVVRRMLDQESPLNYSRFSRMVMLGPPNLGAQLARRFQKNLLLNLVWGKSGKQLARNWDHVETELATPDFEFGILAGGAGESRFSNPLIQGEDDLIVSVEETRLPGAADFRRVTAYHTWLTSSEEVKVLTVRFLKFGYFESEDSREPIPLRGDSTSE